MIEQYLTQTEFSSYDDFCKNLHIRVPARFNFAYDVVDRIASEDPSRPALRTVANGASLSRISPRFPTGRHLSSRVSASAAATGSC